MHLARHGKVFTVSAVALGVLVLSQAPAYATVTNLHASGCAGNGDHTNGSAAAFTNSQISGTPNCFYAEVRIEGFNWQTGKTTWYYGLISRYESALTVSNGDYIEAYQGRVAPRSGDWGPWTNLVALS
jgi:hypothetical protein